MSHTSHYSDWNCDCKLNWYHQFTDIWIIMLLSTSYSPACEAQQSRMLSMTLSFSITGQYSVTTNFNSFHTITKPNLVPNTGNIHIIMCTIQNQNRKEKISTCALNHHMCNYNSSQFLSAFLCAKYKWTFFSSFFLGELLLFFSPFFVFVVCLSLIHIWRCRRWP